MACELFDVDLKLMGFSNEPRCVYERRCLFANCQNINKTEISEHCQALQDAKDGNIATIEDIQQEMCLKSPVCASRLN